MIPAKSNCRNTTNMLQYTLYFVYIFKFYMLRFIWKPLVLKQIGEECFIKCKKLLITKVNWITAITNCGLTPGRCRTPTEAKLKALLSDESLSAQNETIKVSFKNYIPLDNDTLSLTTG